MSHALAAAARNLNNAAVEAVDHSLRINIFFESLNSQSNVSEK